MTQDEFATNLLTDEQSVATQIPGDGGYLGAVETRLSEWICLFLMWDQEQKCCYYCLQILSVLANDNLCINPVMK